MVFVNKLDRERADFERTLDQLRDRVRRRRRPARAADRRGGRRSAASPTCSPTRPTSTTRRHATHGEIPDDMADARAPGARQPRRGHRRRRRRAARALPRRRRARRSTSSSTRSPTASPTATVFPVVCGSATDRRRHRPAGRLHLRDRPVARRPAAGRRCTAGDTEVEVAPDPTGEPLAFVFKTIADPYVGQRLAVQGAVGHDQAPTTTSSTPASGTDERLHGLFTLRGKEQDAGRPRCRPATSPRWPSSPTPTTGDTLAPKGTPVDGRSRSTPPRAGAGDRDPRPDPGRRGQARRRAAPPPGRRPGARRRAQRRDAPDPAARAWARPTSPIALERLRAQVRRRGRHRGRAGPVPRDDHRHAPRPRASTRSRPAATASSAWRASASSRSSGATASSSSTRSSAAPSPASYIPAVEKGIEETMAHGGVLRLPGRRRARSTCFDGKYHSVDSSEMASRWPARLGVQGGAWPRPARCCSSRSRCSRSPCPTAYQGDVMGDLNARRGRVQGTEAVGDGEQRSPPSCRRPRSCATPSTCAR